MLCPWRDGKCLASHRLHSQQINQHHWGSTINHEEKWIENSVSNHKVKTKNGTYCLLEVNEYAYNPQSNVALLLEYQVREHGCIIDSMSRTHLVDYEKMRVGTQTFQPAPNITIDLINRDALMTYDIIPPTDEDL